MQHGNPVTRLALALALGLSAASLVAIAADPVTDSTEIEVISHGVSEKVTIDNLSPGETRQVYSEAGTLVTVTSLADSIQLDIGGEKTSVPMVHHGELSEAELIAMLEKDGIDTGDSKHVVRIHHADDTHGAVDGQRKVIVIDQSKDGKAGEPHVIVKGDGAGKQVIVKRKIAKADASSRNK